MKEIPESNSRGKDSGAGRVVDTTHGKSRRGMTCHSRQEKTETGHESLKQLKGCFDENFD